MLREKLSVDSFEKKRQNQYVLLGKGLFILFAVALLLGCSASEITYSERIIPEESEFTYSERIIPEESEFTYSISISAPAIQISGGNLHWHKELPSNTYTLEDLAIEIYNFGDFDILVTQLEMRVDENSRLFNVDMVIPKRVKESLAVQPMMEGYDGGIHIVYVVLLNENSEILYESDAQEIGPLESIPGTGSWQQVQNY